MDIRTSLAATGYTQARTATQPAAGSGLAQMAQDFAATLNRGEETARAAMTGGTNPQALVEALASSQLAVETVTTVRDKVVEAYQEILRMPI